MILSYLHIALWNFRKQRTYTTLNLAGLCIGMTASILIFQYVKYERSFDSFHSNINNIYRIQYNGWQNGQLNFESALAVPAVGPALKNNFGEVQAFTRLFHESGVMLHQGAQGTVSFTERRMFLADSSTFTVFSFNVIKGNSKTALQGKNKAAISETTAKKYFGSEEPLGKILKHGGMMEFEVTAVFKDIPENSHIKIDILLSFETMDGQDNLQNTSWGWYDFYVYVLLKPGTDVDVLQSKWNNYVTNVRGEEWKKRNAFQEFILRPVKDIHLESNLLYETEPNEQRDGDSVYALGMIAILILIIGWVNYINLATARSMMRANEVGVRKVVGARQSQLISQFLTESALLNLVALFTALALVYFLWTPFFNLTGWHVPIEFLFEQNFLLLVVLLFTGGVFLSGFYPAIVLSSFKPVTVLKGKVVRSSNGNLLRRSLVVVQFAVSIFLIAGSIIVHQQVSFMRTQDLGVSIDNTIVFRQPEVYDSLYGNHLEGLRNDIVKIAGVKSFSVTSNTPGDEIFWSSHVKRLSGGPEGDMIVSSLIIDDEYIPTFDVKMIAGRHFSRERANDEGTVLINESMARMLQFPDAKSAVGEKLKIRQSETDYETLEIIGVVKDYHQLSLKTKILPIVFRFSRFAPYYALKFQHGSEENVMSALRETWEQYFPDAPLDYFFLNQRFDSQYDKDHRFADVFNLFTALAIFLSCLGLVGLASFITQQRTKEIGVRKVLGSTVTGIVTLLSRSFLIPVFVANLFAWPIVWWAMNTWLESFPYHISINLVVLFAAGSLVVVIAFLSVCAQTIRAANASPIKSLKHE